MKKNYLITGGAGFIGSRLAEYLKYKKGSIYIIDDLSTGSLSNIKKLPKNIRFIKGDCAESEILKKLQKIKFDTIFHIAGQSSGEISFDSPINDLNRNLVSTVKLAEFSLKNNVRKFVYASSMSVYGDLKEDNFNAKEKSKCNPLSFYGISKLTSENYLKTFSKLGLDVTILRFFNVYGPNQNLKNLRQGMISIYLGQLLKSNTIIVKGSLKRFRDFIYIDDVVEAIIKILKSNSVNGKILNIGSGKCTQIKKIIKKIQTFVKQGLPQFGKIKLRKEENYKTFPSIKKAKILLNWKPKISFDEGLLKTIKFYEKKIK